VAGKKVKVRFRVGTDDGTGAPGWDIDDVAFGGITNKPFGTLVDQNCNGDAGVKSDGGAADAAGTGGSSGAGGSGGGSGTNDGGCSCSVPGAARTTGTSGLAISGVLLAMWGRRRARRRP
jgi:hypothetical protein